MVASGNLRKHCTASRFRHFSMTIYRIAFKKNRIPTRIFWPNARICYSCRSASMGFIRAAMTAGYSPNPIPIMPLMTKLPITDQLVICVG